MIQWALISAPLEPVREVASSHQCTDEAHDEDEPYHGLGDLRERFVIDQQASAESASAERLLDAPSFGKQDKALGEVRAADDLNGQIDGAITVLHGRIGHPHGQEVAATLDQDVTLAAPDLFGSIVAARPARCHDLDRLAVNDPERRAGLAPLVLAHSHEQRVVHADRPDAD